MVLKKVSVIDYDRKDTDLVMCSNCNTSNFSVFAITHKIDEEQHLHIRCIFCDLTFCPELNETKETIKIGE